MHGSVAAFLHMPFVITSEIGHDPNHTSLSISCVFGSCLLDLTDDTLLGVLFSVCLESWSCVLFALHMIYCCLASHAILDLRLIATTVPLECNHRQPPLLMAAAMAALKMAGLIVLTHLTALVS